MKFRFRITLLTSYLAVVCVLMLVFGGISYEAARFTAHDLSDQLLNQATLRADQQIQRLLNEAMQETVLNVKLAQSNPLTAAQFPKLVSNMGQTLETHPELTSMFIGLEQSEECVGVSRLDAKQLSVWQLTKSEAGPGLTLNQYRTADYPEAPFATEQNWNEYKIRQRPWYLAAQSHQAPVWSRTYPFIGIGGSKRTLGVTYSYPIYAEGKLIAVFACDFSVNGVAESLKSSRIGERGFTFIVETNDKGNRYVVSHPNHQLLLQQTETASASTDQELLPAAQFGDSRVVSMLQQIPYDANPRGAHTEAIRLTDAGESYLGQFARLSDHQLPNWLICTILPEREIMGRIDRHNLFAFLIFALCLGAIAAISLYLSSQVSRPLESLAQEAEAIGKLQLDAREPLGSVIAEVDRLDNSMLTMKTGLRSFQKYVPTELVAQLMETGQEAEFGGESRELTVFFSDIEGFTTIAEDLTPEQVVEILREYLDRMNKEIVAAGGTVDKYIGDAVMAIWGAPRENPKHAAAACAAALQCQAGLRELCAQWQREGKPTFRMRIGLHTGDVVVGNVGSEARLNYTVIGDTVNLASRLEGLNKQFSTELLISEQTYQAAGGLIARPLDLVAVKGKTTAVLVYELLALESKADKSTRQLAEQHTKAWTAYRDQDWATAIRLFEKVLELNPNDPPAQRMIARCKTLQTKPPGDDWDGVFRMQQK